MKYRKKPVTIEAVQITEDMFDGTPNDKHIIGVKYNPIKKQVEISTLEGTMVGNLGDYIIKGIAGELYPCKPDVFKATYEKVE